MEEAKVVMEEENAPVVNERKRVKALRIGIYCILIFVIVVVIAGVGFAIYWLSVYAPQKPTLTIEDFYIPALNRTSNETRNTTLFYNLKFINPNRQNDIRYGSLNITIYYGQNLSFPIANVSIPGFDQGFRKKARRTGAVEAVGMPWYNARREVSNGTTTFRVNLDTTVKNSVVFWYSKRQGYKIGNTLRVNDRGSLVKRRKKGVELTMRSRSSSAPTQGRHHTYASGILVGFALLFICF